MKGARPLIWASLKQFGYYLLTGLILVIPALMNESPLVYSDSGTYMHFGFDIGPAIDRPVGYSLIIRAVTWRSTMWSLIFFQGTIASWLLFEVMRQLFPGKSGLWRLHIAMVGVLTLVSSLPWYASQIMPDVLAGLLALVLFLLFVGRGLHKLKLAFLWVLLFFFTISHYSHMALMIGLIVFLAMARMTKWGRRAMGVWFWRKWACLVAMLAGGFAYLIDLNHRNGKGAVLSPTSDLFIAAKLVESGVMYAHLKRTCPERDHWLCGQFNDFNTSAMHYVWDEDNSLRQHRDMEEASRRLAPLVDEILTDPRNWGMLLWTSLNATLIQLTQVEMGSGLVPYRDQTPPWHAYQDQLHHELPLYMDSHQNLRKWDLGSLNAVGLVVLLCALFVLILRWPAGTARLQALVLLAVATVVLNAAATGALANVYARLQARVTWLIVFAALLLIARASHGRIMRWLQA